MTRKGCLFWGCLTPLTVIILISAVLLIAYKFVPSRVQRALPESATDVQEYYSFPELHGDFVHVLKARLPESDYVKYAKALGLTMKYDANIHGSEYDLLNIDVGGGFVPKWWDDEPTEMDNCYFQFTPGQEKIVRVKWKDGWVYFLAIAW